METFTFRPFTSCQCIKYEIHLILANVVSTVVFAFMDFINDLAINTMFDEVFTCTTSRFDVIAKVDETFCKFTSFCFGAICYGHKDGAIFWNTHSFKQCFRIGTTNTHNFTSRFHFRSKSDFYKAHFGEGEYRCFYSYIWFVRYKS